MKLYLTTLALVLPVTVFLGDATAANITINDNKDGTFGSWSSGSGLLGQNQGKEDQEVEPGMVGNQVWDLEGFFLTGTRLSLVGGFDFRDGVAGYSSFTSGDIFISTDATFGTGPVGTQNTNATVTSNYGYEYVLKLNFPSSASTGTQFSYQVFNISGDEVKTQQVYYTQNQETNPSSSPWKYVSGGTELNGKGGTFTYTENTAFGGFTGGTHYMLDGFDLSFLPAGTQFYSHFTMGCGNDNLIGFGTVPEPTTMLLFGTGLVGLSGFARRRKK